MAATVTEIAGLETSLVAARSALNVANDGLSGARTVENVALNTIADFIDTIPITIISISCTVAASALSNAEVMMDVKLEVDNEPKSLSVDVSLK